MQKKHIDVFPPLKNSFLTMHNGTNGGNNRILNFCKAINGIKSSFRKPNKMAVSHLTVLKIDFKSSTLVLYRKRGKLQYLCIKFFKTFKDITLIFFTIFWKLRTQTIDQYQNLLNVLRNGTIAIRNAKISFLSKVEGVPAST